MTYLSAEEKSLLLSQLSSTDISDEKIEANLFMSEQLNTMKKMLGKMADAASENKFIHKHKQV